MKMYLEHVYKCEHRRITVRAEVEGHIVKVCPSAPVCMDCGLYEMPFVHPEDDGANGAGFVARISGLPLALFVHEHNDT